MPVSVGELDVRVAGDVRDAQAGLRAVAAEIVEIGEQADSAAAGVAEVAVELTRTETAASKATKAVASTSTAVGDLGGKAGVTHSKLDGVLDPVTRATRPAAAGITTVSDGLMTVGERAKKAQTGVSATATAMAALGTVSGGAASKVASVGNALFTGFASGGVLGVGIAAVTAGIFALSGAASEARQEARQFTALAAEYGTTERQVVEVSEAFERTGQTLDRSVVQQLIRASAEAGTSTVELAAMADEIKRIQDLTGKDVVASAADAAAKKAKARGEDYLVQLRAQAQAREDQQSGLAQWESVLAQGSARDAKALEQTETLLKRLRVEEGRAVADFGYESQQAKKLRTAAPR